MRGALQQTVELDAKLRLCLAGRWEIARLGRTLDREGGIAGGPGMQVRHGTRELVRGARRLLDITCREGPFDGTLHAGATLAQQGQEACEQRLVPTQVVQGAFAIVRRLGIGRHGCSR